MTLIRKCLLISFIAGSFVAPRAFANVVVLNQVSNTDRANPGHSYRGTISIRNEGEVEERVSLSQDGYLFFSDGSNIFGEPAMDPRSKASRIKLAESELSIPHGAEFKVPYTIKVTAKSDLADRSWSLVTEQSILSTGYLPSLVVNGFAEGLSLGNGDLRISPGAKGGYELWIRKTSERGSVLLIESDNPDFPDMEPYTLRDVTHNAVNGDEQRILNGKFLDPSLGIYSLVDSTAEPDPLWGEAFHIHLPPRVIFGYPETRYGEMSLVDGSRFKIRVFARPFANYSGTFEDTPIVLHLLFTDPRPSLPQAAPVIEKLEDKMLDLDNETALMEARTQVLAGNSNTMYELLDQGRIDYDALFSSLDISIRNNVENGYIIDPRDTKNLIVYISKIFRYTSTGGIKDGDTGYVFRGENEPIGYIQFTGEGEELTVSILELASPDKPLQPFDKIMLNLK